jgi:hypothetical protein
VQWRIPVTLAIWEAEIWRMDVQGQPWKKVLANPSQPTKCQVQ